MKLLAKANLAAKHISNNQNYYLWLPISLIAIVLLGLFSQWLNNGHKLLDDPSVIYSYALEANKIILALVLTSLYSGFLNNSLTREEYVKASVLSKACDNASELIVFYLILTHL